MKLLRLSWLGLLLLCALSGCTRSPAGFSLVSTEEYRTLKATPQPSAAEQPRESKALDIDAPEIIIDAPDPHAAIRPPLRLAVRFQPAAHAQIDVSSFQVIYQLGFLHKDITDRIRPFVTLTPGGVSGESSVAIPAGEHTLILRIRDTQNHQGEQKVTFRVAVD